tara:strand:+ start:11502 stop:12725 length:1224 start_codon:yes stop_codon:yes gene_type:complete
MKNAFYAQSGGVTSVINSSAFGLFSELKEKAPEANIYVGKNGIIGLIEDEVYDINKSKKPLELLIESPGGMFGSCRYKLPDIEDEKFYRDLFKKLEIYSVGYFFYNGGNDSADTCYKVSEAAKKLNYSLNAIAIPKTIDNDLAITDNCPGFGSVAKYIATSAKEASLDIRSMCKTSTKVFILEVMGRHAGWIAAAAELANDDNNIYVHKILMPEVPFNEESFLNGVQKDVEKFGYSVIVASEGLKNQDGEFYTASAAKDSFGHSQLGGVAPKLANLVSEKLKYKYHWSVSDYLQRSARHISSETDIKQAISVGKAAANMALENKSGIMPIITRDSNNPYKWSIEESELQFIANKEKIVPPDFISEDGFRITKKGVDYLRPLTIGESYPKYKDGIPAYEQIDLHLAKI